MKKINPVENFYDLGTEVTIQCKSKFLTKWRFNGKTLPDHLTTNNILHIKNVSVSDRGSYECEGYNKRFLAISEVHVVGKWKQ